VFTEKSKLLADAPDALNSPDQPWEVTIEQDSIVARWRWMDAAFFAPGQVSSAIKDFTFIVKLKDNGTWKELDQTSSKEMSASTSGAKMSASKFVGKTSQKSIEISFGKNRQTGETGLISVKFDTAMVKRPIREYLTANGWKKASLFGFLK